MMENIEIIKALRWCGDESDEWCVRETYKCPLWNEDRITDECKAELMRAAAAALEAADKRIAELMTEYWMKKNKWISVKDRLPEPNEHVLVCCDLNGYCISGSYMCVAFRTDDMTTPCGYDDDIDSVYDEDTDEYYFPVGWWEVIKNWDDYSCVAINDTVTHWMPLPDAPEVEE